MLIRIDQPVCRALNYGETEKVRINGKQETLKADGELENYIVDQVARRNGLSEKGMLINLRDPRLGNLLGNPREIDRLMNEAGRNSKEIPSGVLQAGTYFRRYYSKLDSAKGPKPNFPVQKKLLENLEIKSSILSGDQCRPTHLEGRNVIITRGVEEGNTYNLVSITAETPKDFQRISAQFDPQTGKIEEETIREFIIHNPKR